MLILKKTIKGLARLVLYVPLRLVRFASKLAAIGCIWWFMSTHLHDQLQWLLAGTVALVVLIITEVILHFIGRPELL